MNQARHWAEIQESGIVWGMRALLKIYLLCGRRILQLFLYPVVSYYWLINKQGRQASEAYLARVANCSPALKPGGSYQHFICFANALIDKLAAWSGALSRADVEYHGREALMVRIAGGRGAVLLGSHLGNLDVCRVLAYLDKDIRINVLVHTKHAEKFNRLLSHYNAASSLNLIQVTEITAATSILLNDKIDNGELVIITADRTPVSEQPRVLRAQFLGDDAPFPQGPFILAALLKCPVYTLFCLKQRGKHVIYFDPFSDGLKFPRKTREQSMQATIQRYAKRLQAYCLKEPLQWFNFFDFWRN